MSSTTDVLIIGAGPVGMTMAMELFLQNVSFRIIEKAATRSPYSRALAVHPRTLEVLDRWDDSIDELLSHGAPVAGNFMWVNRKRFEAFDAESLKTALTDTHFKSPLMISQVDTETFMDKQLDQRGIQIERPVTVKSIVQDKDSATVILAKDDGNVETVRCKYVVGCDGAHSCVRHSADVKFEGEAYPQEFILADAQIDWDEPLDRVHVVVGDAMIMFLPMKDGLTRMTASRPAQSPQKGDPTLEEFQELLTKMLPGEPKIHDPVWLAQFHLHHRCVNKYRDGRLFMAGDAAHIHSPIGGQGMNTGIQDAVNLGWKLARVLEGVKPDSFLDTYHDERWPVGQHLIVQTDQAFQFIAMQEPTFRFLRNLALPYVLPYLKGKPEFGVDFFHYLSELGVKYRRSKIVGTASGFDGPIRGGFRTPDGQIRKADGKETWLHSLLRGPAHHVLLFTGAGGSDKVGEVEKKLLEAKRDRDQVHVICNKDSQDSKAAVDISGDLHKRYGFETRPGYVYVRPDGYVEHIGYLDDMDRLFEWL